MHTFILGADLLRPHPTSLLRYTESPDHLESNKHSGLFSWELENMLKNDDTLWAYEHSVVLYWHRLFISWLLWKKTQQLWNNANA